MNSREPHLLSINGHTLAALAFNDRLASTPVIYIHGIGSSIYFWVPGQTDQVKNNFPWYSLSLPGHYPAVLPPDFYCEDLTVDALAGVLIPAVRELAGDRRPILIGHSTGGFSVLLIAALVPDLPKAVISVSGFAQGQWTGVLGILQRLARGGATGKALFKAVFKMITVSPSIYRLSLRSYAADRRSLYANPDLGATIDMIYPAAARLDLDSLLYYFTCMPDINITDLLPRITAPLLVLAGDHDPIVPPDQSRLIASRVPGSSLRWFEGAGHLPMAERGSQYHQWITEWIQHYA